MCIAPPLPQVALGCCLTLFLKWGLSKLLTPPPCSPYLEKLQDVLILPFLGLTEAVVVGFDASPGAVLSISQEVREEHWASSSREPGVFIAGFLRAVCSCNV